jgi:HEAT repeat protein
MEKAEQYHLAFLDCPSTDELQLRGISGFEALGTNAAPAVAELTKLLNDEELAFAAVRCLDFVGKPAEAALCLCLTNRNSRVRELSVAALASVTPDVARYLARIKPLLRDADPEVRLAAIGGVAAQTEAPDLAVPLLIQALQDVDDNVSAEAAGALSGFGTNASSAFSVLTNLVQSDKPNRMRAALRALVATCPDKALSVLSNAVVNGDPRNLAATLVVLKSIAPELALQLSLTEMHSSNAVRCLQALTVIGTYDTKTPGVAGALKSAASDPEPQVAQRAVMVMRQLLMRQKGETSSDVVIPGEPSFQGKPLGEWLKMRKEGWSLETNAVLALEQIGTNVIPALLTRLEYRDPVFGLSDYEVSMSAVGAFISLPDQTRQALPALESLMDGEDRDIALRAMLATLGTGTNAFACLMKGLTNRSPDVRNEAINYLTGEWSARFPELRQKSIPALGKMQNDPDQSVQMNATDQLKKLTLQRK